MAESKLRNLSVEFSVNIIKPCETIKEHYSLTNQLERSGTSIGANLLKSQKRTALPLNGLLQFRGNVLRKILREIHRLYFRFQSVLHQPY